MCPSIVGYSYALPKADKKILEQSRTCRQDILELIKDKKNEFLGKCLGKFLGKMAKTKTKCRRQFLGIYRDNS